MSKLKLMGKNHSDELYTPKIALESLLPYLNKNWVIWESAWGTGLLAKHLRKEGFKVVKSGKYDIEITNPPYSDKDGFLERAYERGKPFIFLMPITALEGIKRQKMYKQYGIQIIFPKKRIDFNGKGRPWFYTCWFTYGFNLSKDLNFIDLKKELGI